MDAADTTTTKRPRTGVLALAILTLVWVGTLALAKFGPGLLWEQPALSWIAVGLNLVAGIGWILAHARYLRASDDLQRKIMLDAIAVALGTGLVGGFAASAASTAGLIQLDSDLALVSVVMAIVYIAGVGVGYARYR